MAGRTTYRNVFTSDEVYNKVDKETRELINDFIRDFQTRSSPSSVKIYQSNFKIFFCWNVLYNDNIPFTQINKRALKKHMRNNFRRPLTQVTRSRYQIKPSKKQSLPPNY